VHLLSVYVPLCSRSEQSACVGHLCACMVSEGCGVRGWGSECMQQRWAAAHGPVAGVDPGWLSWSWPA
jgi:hypothetical protein